MDRTRYIPNTFTEPLTLSSSPSSLLKDALEEIIRRTPPQHSYQNGPLRLGGILAGPTALAYLFFRASQAHPNLVVAGHSAARWAKRYLRGDRGHLKLQAGVCGLKSEKLAYEAVEASMSRDLADVRVFLASLAPILDSENRAHVFPSELFCGKSGTLYFLRMVRHFVPESASLLEGAARTISRSIIDVGDDGKGNWLFHGKHYFGAAHGDIGILTQLLLTTPSLAPELEPRLDDLLDIQLDDGNWPSSSGNSSSRYVQWCHGAGGFVLSLVAVRDRCPRLQAKIDAAVEKGRDCIWRAGILRKEPSLCHGLFGNALALDSARRNHFLSLATPQKMDELKSRDSSLFETAAYGADDSLIMNYWNSAAWTWLVCEEKEPGMIVYTDL
ncbi:hypothetical protein jhhlp_003966 [Lomentospora prolificans]|uniref:Uncharacterized protein n=1 Tax=Lomentospora prolificans TaxID=41688 RepID=A0A2N3NAD8_9PEZI|nr:hypothetical protein jhhlp_003966 [Lomentospora prolificans]